MQPLYTVRSYRLALPAAPGVSHVMSPSTVLMARSSSFSLMEPDDSIACTAAAGGRWSMTPMMPLLMRMGTMPSGAGRMQVTLPAPLSISMPLMRRPRRSSDVCQVPPCSLMYQRW